MATYLYDRGEGRFKHRWKHPYAGFEPSGKGPVGKCSSEITQDVAQKLLDEGIQFKDDEDDRHPAEIYNVHKGVPYVAVPTMAGSSYHGYPCRGRMPRRIVRALEQRSVTEGFHREFKDWCKSYIES